MSQDSYFRNEVKEIIAYLAIGITMMILIPYVAIGFIGSGFEDSFTTGNLNIFDYIGAFIVYIPFIIASLFYVIFPLAKMFSLGPNEHPAEKPNPSWFRILTVSFIHAPEENGALYYLFEKSGLKGNKNPMRWSKSLMRLLIVSLLLTSLYGVLLVSFPELKIASIPQNQVLQQITPISEVVFSAEPPAFSETMTVMFIFSLLMGVVAYISAITGLGRPLFFSVGLLLISPLTGLIWRGIHNIVYGASDASLQAVLVFGWGGSTLTLLIGGFVLWYFLHYFNNFFLKLGEVISVKEDVYLIFAVIWILGFISYIAVEYFLYKYNKKREVIGVN